MRGACLTNEEIADALDRVASLLEVQSANPYRVNAYRRAARVVDSTERCMDELAVLTEGETLEDLPEIGKSIAASIREIVHTGRLRFLERLEGQTSPEDLFTTVPGIGEVLSKRIHSGLQVDTLEELEQAARDGRLKKVKRIGERGASVFWTCTGGNPAADRSRLFRRSWTWTRNTAGRRPPEN